MPNSLALATAEVTVLTYKLDKIRNHINRRITMVDPIVKNELQSILNMIEQYEVVPDGWTLQKPLVEATLNNE